ncbi:GNAT family N-acetyltransferase [Pseudomonas sp. GW6]
MERIVALLACDPLGQSREDASTPLQPAYVSAFAAIEADPNQLLAVVTKDEQVVGTVQITYLPNISRLGAWRAQIEAVRIDASCRSDGLGRKMFLWVFEQARARNCQMIQLTCDLARKDAQRFYEDLGFKASHIGYKKSL